MADLLKSKWKMYSLFVTAIKDHESRQKVNTVKTVVFQSTFSFVDHVDYILKICSQRIFLLKQLRDQGLPLQSLYTVWQT